MRLIDADALPRHGRRWGLVYSSDIDDAPTIYAVPVVRCRECKYSDTYPDGADNDTPLKCLSIRYGGVYPDWFCEHGERREDGDA